MTGMSYAGVDAGRLLDALTRWRPESLILVPELLRLLIGAVQRGNALPFLRYVAVGGAAVSPALLEEARARRVPVFEGYGLSECGSVVCLNTPGHSRSGSVGRALPHVRVRCDERGELHVRGASMQGYLGVPGSRGLDEIATGDTGSVDRDGYVYVRGRVRNIFISSFGRNVSPEWIERELTCESAIQHAVVVGEAQPFPVALVVPRRADTDLALVRQAVERANTRLPDYAQVRQWAPILEAPSAASGLLTANGRLRRDRIRERYAELIDRLLADPMRKAS
jgi:long-subunit acyl-CoA synthetase (AMP-forming)